MNRTVSSGLLALGLAALGLSVSAPPALAYKMEYPSSDPAQCQPTSAVNRTFTSMCPVDCTSPDGFVHWADHDIGWRLNTAGPGFDKAPAIQAALATWSSVLNSTYSLDYLGSTSATGFAPDSNNSMFWGNADSLCNSSLCHAITALYIGPGEIIQEADILFNSSSSLNLDWRTDGTADPCSSVVQGNRVDTQAIATHELGHALGIAHPSRFEPSFPTATMGGASCNLDGRSLSSDDKAALLCADNRYPQRPLYEGQAEVTRCKTISGWAWSSNRPFQSAYVDVLDGSKIVADVEANLFRSDLLNAGKGNGAHGYSMATPFLFKNGKFHTVSVRFSGTGGNLTSSPSLLACNVRMFPNLTPATYLSLSKTYTVATQFSSSQNGVISQLLYYKAPGEPTGPADSRTFVLHLWTDTGAELAWADVSTCDPGLSGSWCSGSITPVSITAGTRYRVGVNTNMYQSKTDCGIGSGITSGPLTAIAGYWIEGKVFPTTASCSNFFVDVVFDM